MVSLKKLFRMWRYGVYHRAYINPESEEEVVKHFSRLYYDAGYFGKTWQNTRWLGVTTWKCPLDLWIYQETLYELKPDLIIECGTAMGGSAFYLAKICDLIGSGKIITVDIEHKDGRPQHERIEYIQGSSVDPEIVKRVKDNIRPDDKVLAFLDSDHSRDHVLAELRTYCDLVTTGSYMIVEDSNLNGHPVSPDHGPGPMEAIEDFLQENDAFEIDPEKEKFYMTFNPKGYLRKVK